MGVRYWLTLSDENRITLKSEMMDSPRQIVEQTKALLEEGRGRIAAQDWEAARLAIEAALKLDENSPSTYEAMADLFGAMGEPDKCDEWREKAQLVRKQAWQRQVEAEARGHHDLLGEPIRHEIP